MNLLMEVQICCSLQIARNLLTSLKKRNVFSLKHLSTKKVIKCLLLRLINPLSGNSAPSSATLSGSSLFSFKPPCALVLLAVCEAAFSWFISQTLSIRLTMPPLPLTIQFQLLGCTQNFYPFNNAHAEHTAIIMRRRWIRS